jgi:xanthine dehydrogenase YagS FAD-binding subunit
VRPFSYHPASSLGDAAAELANPHAVAMGGGTDLLVAIDEGITSPDRVVDLRTIPGGRGVLLHPDGSVRIGGATRLHDIARDGTIAARWPALAQACEAVGTAALRHMGTLGGNLCQRPRCWYFRRNIACHKNCGPDCPAVGGENQYLAIVDGGPCFAVHPSDPAVALTALDATVEIARHDAPTRTTPIAEFYVLPSERVDRETVLEPGEFVTAVIVPAASAGGAQMYRKLMQREAWDFALVSLAATKRPTGDVRLVLGGVAPRPWRVNTSVEEDVASGGLDEESIAALAERALLDAAPLSKNGFKVDLAASLLRDAMRELSA